MKCNIYKVNTYSSGTVLKFRGNIITFPQTPEKLLDILPNIPTSDTIQILFIGTKQPTLVDINKLFNVNRNRVKTALIWLIANNPLYSHCNISENNMSQLPENGVPEFVLKNIQLLKADDSNFQEPRGYSIINSNSKEILDQDPGVDIELDSMALFETNEAIKLEFLDKLVILKKKIQPGDNEKNLLKNIVTIPHGPNPMSEINNPDLLISAYPHLFPYGMGSFCDPDRKVKLSTREHLEYLLELDDSRFQHDKTFQNVVFNIIQRSDARQQIFLMVKKKNFSKFVNDFKKVTLEDLENLAKNYEKTKQLDPKSIFVKLFNNVHSASVKVQGSKASLYNRRMQLKSEIIKFSLPDIYMTINPADPHNPLLLMLANEKIDLDSCSIAKSWARMNIVKRNPYAQAKFFDMIISNFISHVLCYSPENCKEGVLGPVRAYDGVVEANDRGALHGHFLIFLQKCLTPLELGLKLKDPLFRQLLSKWIDSIIKCDLDEYNIREIVPSTVHPCARSLNLDLSQPESDLTKIFKIAVFNIVTASNFHKCCGHCKDSFCETCRYGYPKDLVENTTINEKTGEIIIKRNDPNINFFNGKSIVFNNNYI